MVINMQHQQGFVVTLLGGSFQKQTIFLKEKPTTEEIEEMLKNVMGVKALVTSGDVFIVEDDYVDARGNKIKGML